MLYASDYVRVDKSKYLLFENTCDKAIAYVNDEWEKEQSEYDSKPFLYRMFHKTPKPKDNDCIHNIRYEDVLINKIKSYKRAIHRDILIPVYDFTQILYLAYGEKQFQKYQKIFMG